MGLLRLPTIPSQVNYLILFKNDVKIKFVWRRVYFGVMYNQTHQLLAPVACRHFLRKMCKQLVRLVIHDTEVLQNFSFCEKKSCKIGLTPMSDSSNLNFQPD